MKNMRSEAEVMAEINITPFTDVLLVLLIIFMILAAMVAPPGFQKAWDNCNCTSPVPKRVVPRIKLLISAHGAFFVGATPADAHTIYHVLATIARPQSKLSIIADAKAPYGLVIRALDAAKEAGIGDVSFVSQ
ncbi:MAG: ExbD/TolR family protein [Vulcanimicrobiaceae bacterium]